MQRDNLFFEAKAYYDRGSYQEAASRFQLLTFFYPKKSDYWLAWGHSQKMAKEFDAAIAAYQVALHLFPKKMSDDLLCQMADCHRSLGDHANAIALVEKAVKIAPLERKESIKFLLTQWRKAHDLHK